MALLRFCDSFSKTELLMSCKWRSVFVIHEDAGEDALEVSEAPFGVEDWDWPFSTRVLFRYVGCGR